MAFNDDIKKIITARQKLDATAEKLYNDRIEVQRNLQPDTLASVQEKLSNSAKQHLTARKVLQESIAQLYAGRDQRAMTKELDAAVPFLMLPIRIETRFVTIPPPSPTARSVQQLWVRIYPDDIHVHSHEARLTEAEITEGQRYWLSLLAANRLTGTAVTDAKRAAWTLLTDRRGPHRAQWVARQTMPSNWKPDLNAPDESLVFPKLDPKTHDWTLAPRTQLLPDRFTAVLYRNNQIAAEQTGALIPDTLFLGPDPFKGEQAFKKDALKNIQFDEDFAWMADFDQAVANGMGLKIPVTPAMLNNGQIDRLVVMGLMHSADPAQSAEMTEQMFVNHRFSFKGLSFVPQGTPTNNTEDGDSGYTRNEDMLPLGYYEGTPAVLNVLSEGARTANLLGIDPAVFSEVRNANMSEDRLARAVNTALYPATIGYYFDALMEPVVKDGPQKSLRSFFNSYVTARGPLPALRVGDQPYGILLTSNLNAWTEANNAFFTGLAQTLRGLQSKWNSIATAKAVHVGMSGDPSAALLRILSLQAGSVDFKQRLGNLPDYSLTVSSIDAAGLTNSIKTKQQQIVDFLKTLGFNPEADDNFYPFISNMVFYKHLYPVPQQNLVDQKPTGETRFLDKSFGTNQNYIEWLAAVATLDALEKQEMGRATPPTSLLYLLLRHALIQELQRKTTDFYRVSDYTVKSGVFAKSLVNFQPSKPDLSAWELMRGVPKTLDARKFTIAEPLANFFLKASPKTTEGEGIAELRFSLKVLAGMSTAQLERYLSDHLDLCSYRLDAWQTGLFHRRLAMRRSNGPKGLYIGAFGWVENLRPESRAEVSPNTIPAALRPENNAPAFKLGGNAGFIHTPSLNHAAASGLLLAGYHNHANRATPGTFAVNLSSERVRRGMALLEGIRNGQMLETLLGYQFERALHDITTDTQGATNLNQYILAFRYKFPVQHQSIPQRGAPEVQEAFTAYPVVNGYKLIGIKDADFNALVANVQHRSLIKKEIDRLKDSLDAANDLLLSESAFHITQGNAERTAAVLNAQRNAETPPDIEVIDTPRGTHFIYTNRVSLHFSAKTNGASNDWTSVDSPRSLMEPGLNQWLGAVIGSPENIICEAAVDAEAEENRHPASVTLHDLRIQPIDFVYTMGGDIQAGATELEARVAQAYRKNMSIGDQTPVRIRFDVGVSAGLKSFAAVFPLARALRNLITTSRPASARDFMPQSKEVSQLGAAIYGWDIAELQKRVEIAQGLLSDLLTAIDAEAPNEQPKDDNNPANFGALFARCAAEGGAPLLLAQLPLTQAAAERLQRFMRDAAEFGVSTAFPDFYNQLTRQSEVEILTKSADLWKTLVRKRDLAAAKLTAAGVEADLNQQCLRLTEAGKALLGDEFNVIPRFTYHHPDEVKASLQDRKQLMSHADGLAKRSDAGSATLEGWLQSTARVRQGMDRLEKVRMLTEALDGPALDLSPAQLPYRKTDSWLGVEFPAIDPATGKKFQLQNDTLTFAMFGDELDKTAGLQAALIVDDWTETIPVDKEITGLAYHYNQPNAAPPQSMLLAVEPTGGARWDWDVLLGILNDTLQRAKTRAVEPVHLLEDNALDVLLPMTIASFDLQGNNPSLDYAVTNPKFLATVKNSAFDLYKPWNP